MSRHRIMSRLFIWMGSVGMVLALAACTARSQPNAESQMEPNPPASQAAQPTPLKVFCAGSLILPFDALEKAFEASHPGVDVRMECHGSIQVIRHVTELHELIDIVATADHALIPMLMYSSNDPDSGLPYASWYIRFAGNRLDLAYQPDSLYQDEITPDNWYEIIARPDVRLGLADPRFDAVGYRALMVLHLSEPVYNNPNIFESVIQDSFRYPITAFTEDGFTEISVPEILEPQKDSGIVLRGASIQLIALLESGDLDYAFEYESVISQHNLPFISLPDPVNLSNPVYAEDYSHIQVKLDFQRFASVKPVFTGEPIGYGITIPRNAPHPELAEQFIAFMLSPEGRQVMQENYHPLLGVIACDGQANMPVDLGSFCQAHVKP